MGLLETARVLDTGGRLALGPEEFKNCYGLFGLDLAAHGINLNEINEGSFDVEIRFKNNTKIALCGFLIAEFPMMCTIDKTGNVISHAL